MTKPRFVSGLKFRKMKSAAEKIKNSTGYGGMLSGTPTSDSGNKSPLEDLMAWDTDGARYMNDIIKQIKQNGEDYTEKNVHFYTEEPNGLKTGNRLEENNKSKEFEMRVVAPRIVVNFNKKLNNLDITADVESKPTQDNLPKLSIVNVLKDDFTPTSVNTSEIELFMNGIPSHEFSRCVPFLDVIFEVKTDKKTKKNQRYGLSLHSIVEGSNPPKEGSADQAIATSVPVGLGETDPESESGRYTFGIEMFTTPQTFSPMTTGVGKGGKNRIEPILDKFRPFMSIKSFDVNLVPVAGGFYQKTMGTMKIVLHDRSRMHEIAHLVRPDNFSSNKLYTEYGWSHPDGDLGGNRNPYGDFLNNLRRKQKWSLYNSSFSFRQDGQVDITLFLAGLGNKAAEQTTIDSNEYIKDLGEDMMKIESAVMTLARKEGLGKKISPEYVQKGALGKTLKSFSPKSVQDVLNKIEKMGKKNKSKNLPDVKNLKTKLVEYLSAQDLFTNATDQIINFLEIDVLDSWPRHDPLLESAERKSKSKIVAQGTQSRAGTSTVAPETAKINPSPQWISLAKAFSVFVGRPLVSTGRFQEVQMFFYRFAERKGGPLEGMNALTTGEFLISRPELMAGIRHMMTTYRTSSIPVETFMSFVIENFVQFIGSPQYNMMDDLEIYQNIEKGKRESLANAQGVDDIKKLTDEQKKKINTMNDKIADFIFPKIAVEFESVPRIPEKGQSRKGAEKDTILRIHVYDQHAGKQEPYEELINASTENLETLRQIKDTLSGKSTAEKNAENETQRPSIRSKELNRLITELAEKHPNGLKPHREGGLNSKVKEFTVNLPYETVKQKIAGSFPYVTYGTEASAILSANFRSIQNSHHKNVILSQIGRNPETAANGLGSDGLPIFTTPASLSLEIMGCPLFKYRTAMFFDFKTGTTIDNVYYARSVRHTIQPGSFTTNIEMATRLADGKYRSLYSLLKNAIEYIDANEADDTTTSTP